MLILPPWYFARCTDNQPASPSIASPGTAITPGVSSADGTPVSLISAIPHDVHRIVVIVFGVTTAGAAQHALMDLLADPAGGSSWSNWIDDLCVGFTQAAPGGIRYDFPIWLPAGTSIGAQMRVSHTAAPTTDPRIQIWAFGEPSRPDMWWCGQGVESLGINAASSKGTDVTPGASGSWGAWADVGSPTTHRYGAIQLGNNGEDASSNAVSLYFEAGYNSTKIPGWPTFLGQTTSAESGAHYTAGPVWCDIPAGTQMQIRAMSSGTGAVNNAALYGVY